MVVCISINISVEGMGAYVCTQYVYIQYVYICVSIRTPNLESIRKGGRGAQLGQIKVSEVSSSAQMWYLGSRNVLLIEVS